MLQINPGWFHVDLWVIIVVVIAIVAFLAVAIIWGIRAHQHQASVGREELIGKTAEVRTALDPKGTVFIDGEHWAAVSEKGRVKPGEEVIITKVDHLKLWVTKKE